MPGSQKSAEKVLEKFLNNLQNISVDDLIKARNEINNVLADFYKEFPSVVNPKSRGRYYDRS